MSTSNDIFRRIKKTVVASSPDAKVMLFGSYARGDYNGESDIDLLILLNRDKVSNDDKIGILFALFLLEAEIGIPISPLVYSEKFWETGHRVTPFYESVKAEGIFL